MADNFSELIFNRLSVTRLNFIDVFSGAGGFSCGLEMTGMRCLLGVDHDKNAIATFAKNHRHAETYCGPIEKLSSKEVIKLTKGKTIHAIVGGPPCQGFSTVGLGKPEDDRNHLFMHFVRLVKDLKPHFLVMENVTGLLAKKNEKTLQSIFNCFHKLGYHLDAQVLSAHHYGVAEKRRRTIIIGTRVNDEAIFPKITHDTIIAKTYRPSSTLGDILENLSDPKGIIHNHDLEAAKPKSKIDERRLKRIPEGKSIRYERDEKAYLTPALKLGVDWAKIPENRFRQAKYHRLDRKLPSPTIMTHRHNYFHPIEHRYLTAREAAKIQSFPNDFIFCGPLSAQWRQIGNAVPPLMGKAIGQVLKKMMKNADLTLLDKKRKPNKKQVEKIRGKAFVYREANN